MAGMKKGTGIGIDTIALTGTVGMMTKIEMRKDDTDTGTSAIATKEKTKIADIANVGAAFHQPRSPKIRPQNVS
jgi:hypothetical protein